MTSELKPAVRGMAVAPSDITTFVTCRSLYVGTAGDLAVEFVDGSQIVLPNHPVGYAPLTVRKVLATGTTASNIVRLW